MPMLILCEVKASIRFGAGLATEERTIWVELLYSGRTIILWSNWYTPVELFYSDRTVILRSSCYTPIELVYFVQTVILRSNCYILSKFFDSTRTSHHKLSSFRSVSSKHLLTVIHENNCHFPLINSVALGTRTICAHFSSCHPPSKKRPAYRACA